MKFLCVECDEAMTLEDARGPDEGAMTVIFRCPACERETAMLTNPMETQVVRSLGVSIGEKKPPSKPMDMVRSSLVHPHGGHDDAASSAPTDTQSGSGSKCPFTGVVESAHEEQAAADREPRWTAKAEERLAGIPSFARSMARKSVEQYAEEQGYAEIDETVMDEVRGQFGM